MHSDTPQDPSLLRATSLSIAAFACMIVSAILGSVYRDNQLMRELITVSLPVLFFFVYGWSHPRPITPLKFRIPRPLIWASLLLPVGAVLYCIRVTEFGGVQKVFAGILTAVLVGTGEELLFRGIIFRTFVGYRAPVYVLVSAVLFGLVHFAGGPPQIVATTIMGLAFAMCRVNGATLPSLIVVHAMQGVLGRFAHEFVSNYFSILLPAYVFAFSIAVAYLVIPSHWRARICTVSNSPRHATD